jgi:flagellar hook-associated protein 3 FlgL
MKISNAYLFDQATRNIQTAQSDVSKSREQIASGKSLVRPSDDVSKLRSIEVLKSQQHKVESYKNSMSYLADRFQLEEGVLQSASDILIRLKDLAIQAANDSMSASDRDIIAIEVNGLRDELLSIANTRDVEGNFIFAGSKTDAQPFRMDVETGKVNYEGDNRRLFTSVSDSRMLQVNTDGTQVFLPVSRTTTDFNFSGIESAGDYNFRVGDSVLEFSVEEGLSGAQIKASIEEALQYSSIEGQVSVAVADGIASVQLTLTGQAGIALSGIEVTQDNAASTPLNVSVKQENAVGVDFFNMISDFSTALSSDTRSNIDRAISELGFAQQKISGFLGEIGSKLNTLERQKDINADLGLRVDQMLSSEEDLDYAKAVTQFNAELVRLEAAQASFAKVSQLSLFQFI